MSENCDINVIFPIYGQFGAIRKLDSSCIIFKTYIIINSNILSYKKLKTKLKLSKTALTLLLWVKVLFWPKSDDFFFKKMLTLAKFKGPWY